jgi:hypothetical protein
VVKEITPILLAMSGQFGDFMADALHCAGNKSNRFALPRRNLFYPDAAVAVLAVRRQIRWPCIPSR